MSDRARTDIHANPRSRYGGLILTHNEVGECASVCVLHCGLTSFAASDSGEGAILPTWTAVDIANVRTMRELMEGMRKDGWNVDVRTTFLFDSRTPDISLPSITGMFTFLIALHRDKYKTTYSIPISPDRPIEVSTNNTMPPRELYSNF